MNICTKTPNTRNFNSIANPFETKTPFPLFTDISNWLSLNGDAIRVSLRRLYDPAIGTVKYQNKLPGDVELIGVTDESGMPREGEIFQLSYHSFNGVTDFGVVESSYPLKEVIQEGKFIYFNTPEGDWRLEILDCGN